MSRLDMERPACRRLGWSSVSAGRGGATVAHNLVRMFSKRSLSPIAGFRYRPPGTGTTASLPDRNLVSWKAVFLT